MHWRLGMMAGVVKLMRLRGLFMDEKNKQELQGLVLHEDWFSSVRRTIT
jgi:hypothetical protein